MLLFWCIWCIKNKWIFEEDYNNPDNVCQKIIKLWGKFKIKQMSPTDSSKRLRPFEIHYPTGFFDEASQQSRCGCGAWLMISPTCHYKIHWYRGRGSNMRAEILALWGLMWFASQLYLEKLWVFGDSQVLLDHLNKQTSLNLGYLTAWLDRNKGLRTSFSSIIFKHIYREKNTQANKLTKKGIQGSFGEMHYELHDSIGTRVNGVVKFF